MPTVTTLYAGLLGLLAIYVASRAGLLRGNLGVPVGDGGHAELLLAMRRHANFVENVPLALILLGLLEMNAVSALVIHALGLVLLVTRISHAFGINSESVSNVGRVAGAAGTAFVIVVASIWAVVLFFL